MAVDLKENGMVGCCYYVTRDEKLYFMEDVKFGGVDVVDARELHPHKSPQCESLMDLSESLHCTYNRPCFC